MGGGFGGFAPAPPPKNFFGKKFLDFKKLLSARKQQKICFANYLRFPQEI
jgi:hypothetical protein